MQKRLPLQFFFFLVLLLGCTKEISVQVPGPVVREGQIAGRIILPAQTKVDTSGLTVLSSAGKGIPVASRFAIDTSGNVSTTVLNNRNGDVLLLGYNYPGQTDYDISSESTALALLMNTLTLRSLSVSGKLEMIGKIKSDPSYKELVNQVAMGLQAGKAITDTTNTGLMTAITAVFKSSTGLRTTQTAGYRDPVKIKTANTEVQLMNNQVAHTYVAGVYKDGKQVGPPYVIAGRTLFATSLSEAAAGVFGDGYGIPAPAQFTLSGNGEYTIRIRSGKPFEGDETLESRMARNHNVHRFLLGILRDLFPFASDCPTSVAESIPKLLTSMMAKRETALAHANSSAVFAALALDITGEALQSAEEILEDCGGDLDAFKYLKSIGKTLSLLGIATKFMTGANITAHTNDLFQAKASIDTCFQVVGLKLVKCGELPGYKTEIVSGDDQRGEAGKALSAPLVVKVKTEDGKPAIKTTVSWAVKSGGGQVSEAETETNYDGVTQVSWTPGKGVQQLEAYVNKAKGSTTALFKATAFDGNDRKAEIVSGNSQNGQYGKELANPLKVRVLNGEGKPEVDVAVEWKILAGGGGFKSRQHITDAQGLASASWILGPSGGQNVEVIVKKKDGTSATGSPVVFTAIPTNALPYRIAIVSGSNQEGFLEKQLPNPLMVKVTDKDEKPLNNIAVNWEGYSSNTGVPKPFVSLTNANGVAETVWTLGNKPGNYSVYATLKNHGGLHVNGSPLQFSITAQAPKTECELNQYTAPQILSSKREADANGLRVIVNFRADGPGILVGAGSGTCEPEKLCYPVRLYFLNPGGEWGIAANGYSVKLISGTVNAGTLEIKLAYGYCSLPSANECWEAVYPQYQWKVQLMNKCNQRSAETSI
nr:Ig-like domain-containing protein [uncultured Dyadobacter sp.]